VSAKLPRPRETDLVFVLPGLWANGGYRTTYQWMNRLVSVGCRVRVVAHCDGPGGALLDRRVERLVPSRQRYLARSPVRVLANRFLGDRTPLPVTPAAVMDLLPDDGNVITCWAPWLKEVAAARTTALYAQHWEPVWFGDGTPVRARTEAAMLQRRPTLINSTWLRSHFPAERQPDLQMVFPGVDHSVFRPASTPRRDTIVGPLRIAALGRTEPLKGLAELRRATSAVAATGQRVELRLFGTIGTYTATSGGVTERGVGTLSSSELAALYQDSDVVVTPSWYESFPLPPLEAMACGVPVVTTRAGTEDFAVDDEGCLVVEPRDEAALATALHRIAEDGGLRRSLAEGGTAAAQRFTWDAGYSMFVEGLDRALAQLT
jgi:glycosyltransferase involved in cell wall biosynthesis